MKLLFVGAEAVPYISTGGLGDVLGSLPQAVKSADPKMDALISVLFYWVGAALFVYYQIKKVESLPSGIDRKSVV